MKVPTLVGMPSSSKDNRFYVIEKTEGPQFWGPFIICHVFQIIYLFFFCFFLCQAQVDLFEFFFIDFTDRWQGGECFIETQILSTHTWGWGGTEGA